MNDELDTIKLVSTRLAYLVSQYPAINHTFILREIRTLRSLGFDIDVISIREPDRPLEQLSAEERDELSRTWSVLGSGLASIVGAQLAVFLSRPAAYLNGVFLALRLAGPNARAALLNLAYFSEAVAAGQWLQRHNFRHLHTHFSSTVALFLWEVFPITYSVTIHGPEEFDNAVGFYLRQKVAAAAFACTISQYARSQLMRASDPTHWHKIEVSPLGVDPALFTPRPFREQPERFEILSVGRLAAAKAHAILIQAIGIVINKYGRTNIRLRIAGGGPQHQELQRWIAEHRLESHVFLEGPCSQDKVRQLYKETDLFALASFAEGVPVVLMEAMSMEIACLATWIMGIPELIRHTQDGWLVPPSDPEFLAEAIVRLWDDPQLRRNLGVSGRTRVRELYDLQRNTERLAAIFERRLGTSA